MKKRLTGVAVLVFIGFTIPFLLSRCMGGGGGAAEDSGPMRVYEIAPNGDAEPATADANADGSDDDDDYAGARNRVEPPEALSPDHVAGDPDSRARDDESFSTPPVTGNTGRGSNGSSSGAAKSRQAPSEPARTADSSSAASSSSSDDDYGREDSAPATAGRSANTASSGGQALRQRGSPGSGWVVQIASFTKEANARRLAGQLSDQFDAYYRAGDVNGTTYYRVRVGPFDSENTARRTASRLSRQGHRTLVQHLP